MGFSFAIPSAPQQAQKASQASAPAAGEAAAGRKGAKDCVLCNVFDKGWCKTEFEAFDGCFDAAKANGESEEPCLPLFDQFRACMKKRMQMDQLVKEAMA